MEEPRNTTESLTPAQQLEQQEQQESLEQVEFEDGFNAVVQDTATGEADTIAPEATKTPDKEPSTVQPVTPAPVPEELKAKADVQVMSPSQEQTSTPHQVPQQKPQLPLEAIDEAIRDELEELVKLNPKAAELAREDSPDGEMVRKRLAVFGADQALDRAELIMDRRERDTQERTAREKAVAAYNSRFEHTLQTDHPELHLFAQNLTAAQQEERQQFAVSLRQWIEAKPYAEAVGLMEIAERGRDPQQVSALLTRFKQERLETQAPTKTHKMPDPTAALAVSGRGAPLVPKHVGTKDDFEAGWNL